MGLSVLIPSNKSNLAHAALWLPKGNPLRSHIAGGPFRVTGARRELASLFYLEWVLESVAIRG